MKLLYFLPFAYFANTRLLKGSIAFHILFEWVAALLLVFCFGVFEPLKSVQFAFGAYFAFIALYEIGYLFNDLVSSKKESSPRLRGPQGAALPWVVGWIALRIVFFIWITLQLDMAAEAGWWLYFIAMLSVFGAHNSLLDGELKSVTFLWLAWFRFLAPVIFVVQASQRMGIALGAASLYAGFRLFGYMDSKGLLMMPGRQSMKFRAIYFIVPLSAVLATMTYPEAAGFQVMAAYFCLIALCGYVLQNMKRDSVPKIKEGQ